MAGHDGVARMAFAHEHGLRSRDKPISWLNHTPHATAVYASCSALLPPHATLASRRPARPYLGRTCTDGPRQLLWRLRCMRATRDPSEQRALPVVLRRGPPARG